MTRGLMLALTVLALSAVSCGGDGTTNPSSTARTISFFVTSTTSVTGNLGGLTGADATCRNLASGVGLAARTWRAYLSVEHDASNNNQPTNAKDRIGAGPWYNAEL